MGQAVRRQKDGGTQGSVLTQERMAGVALMGSESSRILPSFHSSFQGLP